jgi:hypothetical protein
MGNPGGTACHGAAPRRAAFRSRPILFFKAGFRLRRFFEVHAKGKTEDYRWNRRVEIGILEN